MSLNILSPLLPLAWRCKGIIGDRVFELVSLIEGARYHKYELHSACTNKKQLPFEFNSGVQIPDSEAALYWHGMVSIFEFEAFISCVKRAMDVAWMCTRDSLPESIEQLSRIDTLNAIMTASPKIQALAAYGTGYALLAAAWSSWGSEVKCIRDYLDHDATLGGLTNGYVERASIDGKIAYRIHTFLPDAIIRKGRKADFTYERRREALIFCVDTMNSLDKLGEDFLKIFTD